jgi:hypothetical protein
MRTFKCLYNNILHDIGEEYFAYKLTHLTYYMSYNCRDECDNPFGFILSELKIPFIPIEKDDYMHLMQMFV